MSKLYSHRNPIMAEVDITYGGGGGTPNSNYEPVRLSEEAEQRVRDGELGEEAAQEQAELDAQRAKSAISLITGNPAKVDRKNRRIRLNPRGIVAEEAGHRLVDEKIQQAERIREMNQLLNQ